MIGRSISDILGRLLIIGKGARRSSCIFALAVSVILNSQKAGAAMTFHQQELQGEVEGGNYSYYHLKNDYNNGPTIRTAAVVLLLFSIEGDADLYVSRSVDRPTYEHGQHDYQSTSCGIDRLDINLNAPIIRDGWFQNARTGMGSKTKQAHPLTVGVYGHPSHPLSRYLLKVLLFVDDKPVSSTYSENLKLQDDNYMTDEMQALASTNRWREWVQQVHVVDDDFGDLASTATFSDPSTQGSRGGEGIGQLLKTFGEVLLAILSFALNILIEVMV